MVQLVHERGSWALCDAHYVAFGGVEAHPPPLCPIFKVFQVLLEGIVVLVFLDFSVDEAVVCKKPDL